MIIVALIALQLSNSAAAATQGDCPYPAVWGAAAPTIGGVGIGTKYSEALSRLGQPTSDTADQDGWREILFPGLSLLVEEDGTVVNVEASESTWSLPSGITVGSSERQVRETYGCSKAIVSSDRVTIGYALRVAGTEELSDEMVWFELVDGVVVKLVLHVAHGRQ